MNLQTCSRCVLDTTVASIRFDENGVCNFCHKYDAYARTTILRDAEVRKNEFEKIISIVKKAGKGKDYDCILGLSGGVDSSYLALVAKDYGLRPLVVHFDNGWNTELAVKNIENIVKKMNYDLHTYVVDWNFFKELQIAYLKASVLDIEVPTDQLIFASLIKLAKDFKINYVLSGLNMSTEGIMPEDWNCYRKSDYTNMKNIFGKYGKGPFKSNLSVNWYKRVFNEKIRGIESVTPFYYLDFNLEAVKQRLINELDWKPYQHKHYESIFTRFYQGYILPKKFNIDKRKAHLSSLIVSGQVTREEALAELQHPTYPLAQQEADKEYVLKKLGLTEQEFEEIMNKPIVSHDVFGYDAQGITPKIYSRAVNLYLKYIGYPLKLSPKPVSMQMENEG